MRRVHSGWILLTGLVACNGEGLVNGSDGGAAPAACASASDGTSCDAIPGCFTVTCPSCGDGPALFMECVRKGQPYGVLCSNRCADPPCVGLASGDACEARFDCHA